MNLDEFSVQVKHLEAVQEQRKRILLTLANLDVTAEEKEKLVGRVEDLCALERAKVIEKLLEGSVEHSEHVESAGSGESSVHDKGEERVASETPLFSAAPTTGQDFGDDYFFDGNESLCSNASVSGEPLIYDEDCQSPAPKASAVCAKVTPSPVVDGAHTTPKHGRSAAPSASSAAASEADSMHASEPRSKRQRIPRETFSPAKEQRVSDTSEYRLNERERQELRKPPEYHESVALLKRANWTHVPGVGKYRGKYVWVMPAKAYNSKSEEDEDFFADPIRAAIVHGPELELP